MEPEQTTSVLSTLTALIPVIVGALIGLVSGIVGTGYSHRLRKSSELEAERRIKLATLVEQAFEIGVWLKKYENYYLEGGDKFFEQSPITKIQALSALYFPYLKTEVFALMETETDYRLWVTQWGKLRHESETAFPSKAFEEHLSKINEVYSPLIDAIDTLVKAASKKMVELSRH